MMGKKKTAKMRGGGMAGKKKTAKMRGGGMMPPVGMKKGGKAPTAGQIMRAARRRKPSGRINADDLLIAKRHLLSKGRKSSKTMTPGEKKRAFKGKQTKMFADARKGFKKMMKGIKTKNIGKTRA
jgi:hypothetical protein|tara:strand:+ start:1729 stop:2103 length:375 start_codon:yes stop_codon:yes gene_type:complete